jgi:branched-chain amino acid transport system substrate-binding protein
MAQVGGENMLNRGNFVVSAVAGTALPRSAFAQARRPLKTGVMNDMAGPYADHQRIGSVLCTQMAVDEFAAKAGVPMEIISADHQNKADIGLNIARHWYDNEGVDVILEVSNSAVALAVSAFTKEGTSITVS